jgi:hypothetical protein
LDTRKMKYQEDGENYIMNSLKISNVHLIALI